MGDVVYALLHRREYEGDELLGVYATRELAERRKREIEKADPRTFISPMTYLSEWIIIKEMRVIDG